MISVVFFGALHEHAGICVLYRGQNEFYDPNEHDRIDHCVTYYIVNVFFIISDSPIICFSSTISVVATRIFLYIIELLLLASSL